MIMLKCTVLFIFVSVIQSQIIPVTIDQYVSLMMQIRNYYKVSTVFYLHSQDDWEDLGMWYLISACSRSMSKFGIMTREVVFSKLDKVKFYYGRIVRPLFVVMLPSDDWEEFSNATRDFDMYFPVWLVIFLGQLKTMEQCHHPHGNPLHLTFSTEMVVLCGDDLILREWYSVDGNRTEFFDLAQWIPGQKLQFLTDKSLFDRRNDLHGTVIRAVIVKNAPFLRYDKRDNVMMGVFGVVLQELSAALNFSIKIVKEVTEYGFYRNGNWTGAVGEVYWGNADMGIGDFSMSTSRLDVIDFTLPLIIGKLHLYVREPDTWLVQWSAYFKVMTFGIWMALLCLLFIASVCLLLMKARTGSTNTNNLYLLFYHSLNLLGLLCQQGLSEFPRETSTRLTYMSMCLTAIIGYSAYSASLISFLTVSVRSLPFNSYEDFIKDGSYKLITFRGSSEYDFFFTSKNPVIQKMKTFMKNERELPQTMIDGYEQVCFEKVAFYSSSEVKKSIDHHIPCRIAEIKAGGIDNLAIILPKQNQFNQVMNYHLQKFVDNGVLNRAKVSVTTRERHARHYFSPVTIENILPILAVLVISFMLGLALLFVEKHYYEKYSVKANSSVTHRRKKNCRHIEHRQNIQRICM